MDEQRTAGKDAEQSEENLEDAQRDRLQDLDVTKEAGEGIKGGVPKQPDGSERY